MTGQRRTVWTWSALGAIVAVALGGLEGYDRIGVLLDERSRALADADALAQKVQFLEAEVARLRQLEEPVCRVDPTTRWHRGQCYPDGPD